MQLDKESFIKFFSKSFIGKLKESIVPFEIKHNSKDLLNNLYDEIVKNTYHPKSPREYIIANKHNYVARIIPTFEPQDYYLYYFCIKMLEEEIAINRIEGTYGGWTLGNKIAMMEKEDNFLILEEYAPMNSFNPQLWMKNWQDFQKKAYSISKTNEYNYYIKFDIRNFYNSVNIELLLRKIYMTIPLNKRFYVEVLSHFLHNWNKKIEGYVNKTIGIPQDEIGDCSRILANFFLQEYDRTMFNLAEKYNSKYMRYSDDQIIFSKNKSDARKILFEASKELFKIDLIINSSKVLEFNKTADFNEYWAFELFDLLADANNEEFINLAVEKYLQKKENNVTFRDNSVLKKIVSLDYNKIQPHLMHKILSFLFDPNFIANLDWWWFKRIFEKLNTEDRKNFLKIIDKIMDEVHFNSYHYNLLMFYKKINIVYNRDKIKNYISENSFQ